MKTISKEIALIHENTSVKVNLRRSSRAKYAAIRINYAKRVELVIPNNISIDQAKKFLIKKQSWVFDKLKAIKDPQKFTTANAIPIFGINHQIIHNPSQQNSISIAIKDNSIRLICPTTDMKRVLIEFLKEIFLKEITEITTHIAKKMGLTFSKIRITNAASKWGSCSKKKILSFHWRLVFAPKNIVTYIVVHEVSHLKEMNHSKAFWKLVASIYDDYIYAKKWLKQNAAELHALLA